VEVEEAVISVTGSRIITSEVKVEEAVISVTGWSGSSHCEGGGRSQYNIITSEVKVEEAVVSIEFVSS